MSSTGRTNSRNPGKRGSYCSAISRTGLGWLAARWTQLRVPGAPVDDDFVGVVAELLEQPQVVALVAGQVNAGQGVDGAGRAGADAGDLVEADENGAAGLGHDEAGEQIAHVEHVALLGTLIPLERGSVVAPGLVEPAGLHPVVLVSDQADLRRVDTLEAQQVVEPQHRHPPGQRLGDTISRRPAGCTVAAIPECPPGHRRSSAAWHQPDDRVHLGPEASRHQARLLSRDGDCAPVRPTTNGVVLPTSRQARDRTGRSRGRCLRRGRLPVRPARRGSVPGRESPSHTARGLLVGTSGVGTGRPGHRPLSPRTEAVCVCGMSPLGHSPTPVFLQVRSPGWSRFRARRGLVTPVRHLAALARRQPSLCRSAGRGASRPAGHCSELGSL